jgi:inorganic pyrophosphatase
MTLHMWHKLPAGPQPPDRMFAVIEVPKGTRNKYEYDKDFGAIRLNRVLYSPLHYPGDYGFFPQTYYDDGDPLDVLVMMQAPTFPGCIVEVRPIGMYKMIDGGERDFKILAVPATDPHYNGYFDIRDIPQHFPTEVGHFFTTYKDLEGTTIRNEGWTGAAGAKETIEFSIDLYKKEILPTLSEAAIEQMPTTQSPD